MKIVDLNLLVYAVNADAPNHRRVLRWWEEALSGDEPVGLAWTVLLGFLRLCTRQGIMPKPLSFERVAEILDGWLAQPAVSIVHPGPRHWEVLKSLLRPLGTAANLTTDAHLAALAIEYRATLYSADTDFRRFRGLAYRNPLG